MSTGWSIRDGVSEGILRDLAKDAFPLAETSIGIYENNGDCILKKYNFSSPPLFGDATWDLEQVKIAIGARESRDVRCPGGRRLYVLPIYADDQVVGAITLGYGQHCSKQVDKGEPCSNNHPLAGNRVADGIEVYQTSSPVSIDMVKSQLRMCAAFIGAKIEHKKMTHQLKIFQLSRQQLLKESTDKLEEALGELHHFFNLSLDMLCIIDFDGYLKKWNPALQATLGYTREELLAKPLISFIHPEEQKKSLQLRKEWVSMGYPIKRFEGRYITKDGSYKWLEWISISDAERKLTFSIARDVTERRKEQEQVLQLASIVESTGDGIISGNIDGTILSWNRGAERIYGYKAEEVIGLPVSILVPPDSREEIKENLSALRRGEKIRAVETVRLKKGGHPIHVSLTISPMEDRDGNIVGFSAINRDITKNRLAEEALRRSEERFYKAFYANPDIMAIIDPDIRVFVDVNKSFLRTFGYERDEVVGRTPIELGVLGREEMSRIYSTSREQSAINNIETTGYTKTGRQVALLVSVDLVELNGSMSVLAVARDVTELKRLEREIARLDRLHIVGEMAAAISHEVRNPMTTVRGFLQMLGQKDQCIVYKDYFDLMIDELDRANSIISEFLSIGKNVMVDLQRDNLNTVIEAILPLIHVDALNCGKSVHADLSPLPDLLLNVKEIRQVIFNLVRNSLEAMGDGGIVTIRTVVEGNEVVLSVEDQGSGIPLHLLDKLGIPFVTTKEKGTGLGLSVCYSIIARHKGKIDVNTGSEGTTFLVKFPLDNQ